jgi:quinol monooxygenase YgiN
MDAKQLLVLGASALASSLGASAHAEETQGRYVRIAQLEIDPALLDVYRAAIREEIETSVRVEPGVLALYAVAERDDPARIVVFEIYADRDAYRAHLETPHFKKYKATTQDMVRSLRGIETLPVMLGAKAR